jgi:hypothetical protein
MRTDKPMHATTRVVAEPSLYLAIRPAESHRLDELVIRPSPWRANTSVDYPRKMRDVDVESGDVPMQRAIRPTACREPESSTHLPE